jgi:hypothetical protein
MVEPTTTAKTRSDSGGEGRGIDLGEMGAVGIGAAAGLAILGAPAAATVGVGVLGAVAFETLKRWRRRRRHAA